MNSRFRYVVGSTASHLMNAALIWRAIPLLHEAPWGLSAWYDAQRIIKRRQFSTVFDVGANTGQTTAGLIRYFSDATVYCFEPTLEPFEKLLRRTRHWPNVRPHKIGLGHEPGRLILSTHSGSQYELNSFNPSPGTAGQSELAAVETIDGFCDRNGIGEIDLLKKDVQGWELNVLKGARKSLPATKLMFIEASFAPGGSDMLPFSTIHDEALAQGFVLSGLYDPFRWGDKTQVYFCSALYTNVSVLRPAP